MEALPMAVEVHTDAVVQLGKMTEFLEAAERWRRRLKADDSHRILPFQRLAQFIEQRFRR